MHRPGAARKAPNGARTVVGKGYDTLEVGAHIREGDMPQTNIPYIWVGQEVSVLTYSGGTKLEEMDRRFIQEGETTGMDVKLEDVRGTLDDVTNLGIVVTVRGAQRFLTWGGVIGIALAPVEG
jgi:hypothetical protein